MPAANASTLRGLVLVLLPVGTLLTILIASSGPESPPPSSVLVDTTRAVSPSSPPVTEVPRTHTTAAAGTNRTAATSCVLKSRTQPHAVVARCEVSAAGRPLALPDFPPCIGSYFEEAYAQHREFAEASARASQSICGGASLPANDARRELCDAVPELDAIYMVHYTAASNPAKLDKSACRREAMMNILKAHRVPIDVWVSPLDREAINATMTKCFYSHFDAASYVSEAKKRRHDRAPISPLKLTQVSVNVKHHLALYDVVKQGRRLAMILEDDVLLRGQFWGRLSEVIDSLRLPARQGSAGPCAGSGGGAAGFDFDVAMIGGCMNLHGYRRKYKATQVNPHVYRKAEARCAHAYIVTNRGAAALLQGLPATAPIDFQISRAIAERNLSTVWIEPYLSVQGRFPKCGSCVTQDVLGADCKSIEKYSREYDIGYIDDPSVCRDWDTVPAANSYR